MIKYDKDINEVLVSAEEIKERVDLLGKMITEDYKDISEPLIMIILMKGAAIFSSDLVRQIKLPVIMDYMVVSSYGSSTESSKEVRIVKDLQEPIGNHPVIVVDDIVDTGHTLKKVMQMLEVRSPASIKRCPLLNKPERREQAVHVDYIGFDIENKFVVGYGLDYAQQYRNLPYIGTLSPQD